MFSRQHGIILLRIKILLFIQISLKESLESRVTVFLITCTCTIVESNLGNFKISSFKPPRPTIQYRRAKILKMLNREQISMQQQYSKILRATYSTKLIKLRQLLFQLHSLWGMGATKLGGQRVQLPSLFSVKNFLYQQT